MQLIDIPLPLPYRVIISNGKIVSSNSRALNLFDLRTKQIDDIIDQESINKLITNTWQQDEQQPIEVVLKTRSNPLIYSSRGITRISFTSFSPQRIKRLKAIPTKSCSCKAA